jgi:Ser/Thr protein kinase RdoA (MazF antagonist)
MAVEASLLTKNDIINLLRTKYGLEGNIGVKKLDRGSSNLYEIHMKDKRYVLKEFNSNKPISLVEKEIQLIEYLKKREILVPQYVQLNDGRYYFIFNGKVVIL